MLATRSRFPEFRLTACVSRSPKEAFRTITNESFPAKWVVYFFWPKDFTPVCGTEIVAFANITDEFSDREAVVAGASIDSEFVHLAWSRQGEGPDNLPFPLLSDIKRELSNALGILDPCDGVAQRATFIVDPGQTIRHVSVNDFSVGRNPREVLRILDALQTDALCPSDWQKGDPTIATPVAMFEQQSLTKQAQRKHYSHRPASEAFDGVQSL